MGSSFCQVESSGFLEFFYGDGGKILVANPAETTISCGESKTPSSRLVGRLLESVEIVL
jgi:hypothetical protein